VLSNWLDSLYRLAHNRGNVKIKIFWLAVFAVNFCFTPLFAQNFTWTLTSAPNEYWASIASSSNGTKLAAAVPGYGIYTSTNSGQTWTQTSAPGEDWTSIASSSDGIKLAAIGDGLGDGIYTSTNSGLTWKASQLYFTGFSIASSSDGTNWLLVL
jgi:hypothetical protein